MRLRSREKAQIVSQVELTHGGRSLTSVKGLWVRDEDLLEREAVRPAEAHSPAPFAGSGSVPA